MSLLKRLFRDVLIPAQVFDEAVIRGKEQQQPDAFIVESAVEEGWIYVKDVEIIGKLEEFGIDPGEAQAISLAKFLDAPILLDQTHARIAAKGLGLKPRGTIFVLLAALRKKFLTNEEYQDSHVELADGLSIRSKNAWLVMKNSQKIYLL